MKRPRTVTLHDFYCIKCGNKGISIMRPVSHLHGSMHLKKLYCLTCKGEVNHVECKNEFEAVEFKNNFIAGIYNE